ncbi:hypothetical protein RB620_18015 [Paenibacillus sp. LHD-117]|uniref:hypothetical protein n=1 Tax=Paenibacillus sp. LHD-117 TaxID=3071412 RepID=UPI0027E185DD|nr:hypothetical protein [Paenibacillus sp. LHD-117]MDQ6421325.1 hypothetical protein [Paenibacillus sp. LHD-117]
MGKLVRRLLLAIVFLILLIVGAGWWVLSYVAPDQELDLSYQTIDVREKATDMVKRLKPELVLTEADINHLIKMNLSPDIADHVMVDGANFSLEKDRLIADMNVTYRDRIPMAVQAEYRLEWQDPNIALRPQSLKVKDIELPVDLLDTIIVPLDLPTGNVVEVKDVRFEADAIRVLFKLNISF